MKIQNKKRLYPFSKLHITGITFYLLLISFFIIPFVPTTLAGGQDATFDSISINAIPAMQGVGGEIEIQVVANFFGGCCYHLYAYNVKAELDVPDNVQIISSLPDTIKSVDAEPGGQASSVEFNWIVTSDVPGSYEIEITVRTSNSGSHTDTYSITFVEGASISDPSIFPSEPSINEVVTISAVVRSGSELIDIENSYLYLWRNTDEFDRDHLKAAGNRIFRLDDDNAEIGNISDINDNGSNEFLGYGTPYQMNHIEFTDNWRIQLDDLESEEFLYYWFWVETSDNKNITSEVYKHQILDYEKKSQMISGTIWLSILVIIIGVILIMMISWKYIEKTSEKVTKTGIFVLGSQTFSKPLDRKRSNIDYTSPEKVRFLIFFLIIAILAILMALAIYFGLFQDLITETGG